MVGKKNTMNQHKNQIRCLKRINRGKKLIFRGRVMSDNIKDGCIILIGFSIVITGWMILWGSMVK